MTLFTRTHLDCVARTSTHGNCAYGSSATERSGSKHKWADYRCISNALNIIPLHAFSSFFSQFIRSLARSFYEYGIRYNMAFGFSTRPFHIKSEKNVCRQKFWREKSFSFEHSSKYIFQIGQASKFFHYAMLHFLRRAKLRDEKREKKRRSKTKRYRNGLGRKKQNYKDEHELEREREGEAGRIK